MGMHWCVQGDGVLLDDLKFKDVVDFEAGGLFDDYKAPEELKEVAYNLIWQFDDEQGHAYLIPYTSRIDRSEPIQCFTSLDMAKVIYDILKDYLHETETIETITKKIDYVELWGYC